MLNKKGFTLIELLIIILLLSAILLISIPIVSKIIDRVRKQQVFVNINSIVESISTINFDGEGNCWYRSKKDKNRLPKGISDLEIFVFRNNSQYKYGVYALDENQEVIINTGDFKSLSMSDSSKWIDNTNPLSYYLGIEVYDISELINTKYCVVLEEK